MWITKYRVPSRNPAAAIRTARMTSAPTIPQKRTQCWYAAGSPNPAHSKRMKKMLSMLSDFSTRYPVVLLNTGAGSAEQRQQISSAKTSPYHTRPPTSPFRRLSHATFLWKTQSRGCRACPRRTRSKRREKLERPRSTPDELQAHPKRQWLHAGELIEAVTRPSERNTGSQRQFSPSGIRKDIRRRTAHEVGKVGLE